MTAEKIETVEESMQRHRKEHDERLKREIEAHEAYMNDARLAAENFDEMSTQRALESTRCEENIIREDMRDLVQRRCALALERIADRLDAFSDYGIPTRSASDE